MKTYFRQLLKLALFLPLFAISQQANAQQKVLIIISSHHYGYFLPEVITPYRLLKEANIAIDIASPYGGKGRGSGEKSLSNIDKNYRHKLKQQLSNPIALSDVNTKDYDAVYIAGGAGPMMDLYGHPQIQRIVSTMYMANKVISADCHGPAALAAVTLPNGDFMVKGKRLTAKSNAEEGNWAKSNYPFLLESRLKKNQAIFSAAKPKQAWVVQDGNLLTGQNPKSAEPMTKQLIAMLRDIKNTTAN
jgi:putative intracellular protease/amidase